MLDQGVVAAVLAVVSLVGLIANSLAIYAVYRFKHLHNTFGVLCAVLAFANLGDSIIHITWSAYGPYLFDEETLIGTEGKIVGHVSLLLLNLKVYAHLGVSVNRLISLLRPIWYHTMETNVVVTSLFVVFPTLCALLQVAPLFWSDDCYFIYFKDIAVWEYGDTPCGNFYSFYIDFILPVVISCGIIMLDGVAVVALWKALNTVSHYDAGFAMKRKIEVGFFVQSVCQMALAIVVYFSFCFLSGYATTDWALFGTTTLAWALLHALDGVIMVAFQARKVLNRAQTTTFQAGSTNGQTGKTGMDTFWTSRERTETAQ